MNSNYKKYLIYTLLSSFNIFSSFQAIILSDKLEMSISTISTLLLVYQLTKLIFEIPTGYVSDKYGKKTSSIFGIILIIVAFFFFLNQTLFFTMIGYVIMSIGYTFISGSLEAIIVNGLQESELKKFNSNVRVFFYIGFALSFILGGYIIDKVEYRTIIFIDLIILFLSLFVIIFIKESKTINLLNKNNTEIISIKGICNFILNNKIILLILLMDFIIAFSFVAVEDFYSFHLTNNLGVSINLVGIIIASQFILSSLLGVLFHKFIKSGIKTFRVTTILFVSSALLIFFKFTPIFLIPLLYLISDICYSIFAPIKYGIFQAEIIPKYRATIISIKSLIISIGASVSFLFISIITNVFSLENTMMIVLTITLICFLVINYLLKFCMGNKTK